MTAEICDPVRQEFIDMYEDSLVDEIESRDSDFTEDDERCMRINAMVDAALSVRKDMDPLLANKLKSLENLRNYKQYLLSEFKLFGAVDKSLTAKLFAEYLLMSLLNEYEIEDRINFDVFGDLLNKAYRKMPSDYQEMRRVFPWGLLVD